MTNITIYGDKISGNCLKVKYVADLVGVAHSWIDVDVVAGEARTPALKAKNPAQQVPFIELSDGRILSQSNAIMRFLAQGTELIPAEPYETALMDQWLFWEQYSHETAVAVARFQVRFLNKSVSELPSALVEKGNKALDVMEGHLGGTDYFVGGKLSLADIALYAYTQWSDEGGFSLAERPAVRGWLDRVREQLL